MARALEGLNAYSRSTGLGPQTVRSLADSLSLAEDAFAMAVPADPSAGPPSEADLLHAMAANIRHMAAALLQHLDRKSVALALLEAADVCSGIPVQGPLDGSTVGTGRISLPDPRFLRRIIRQRQKRALYFDGELFADPAWDMLLDLAAATAEEKRVSVTSLCLASGVPPTTALRWIGQLINAGLAERIDDEIDRRRAFIALTDCGSEAMARYFADMGCASQDWSSFA